MIKINLVSLLPDEDLFQINAMIWEAVEKNNIKLSDDAELSISAYDS